MNPKVNNRKHQQGGVLVMSLVITAVATMGFAAWAGLLMQRAKVVEDWRDGMMRRLSVQNAKVLGRQYAYRKTISAASGSSSTSTLSSNNGSCAFAAWSGNPMTTTASPAGINRLAPSDKRAFGKTFLGTVTYPVNFRDTGTGTTPVSAANQYKYLVKTRNPMLCGDVLVMHKPTISAGLAVTLSGNIKVRDGRAMIFHAGGSSSYTTKAVAFATPHVTSGLISSTNPANGSAVVATNFPFSSVSNGYLPAGSTPDHSGKLSVIDNATNVGNSLRDTIVSVGAYHLVDTAFVSQLGVTYDSVTKILTVDMERQELRNMIVSNSVSEIVLVGQNTTALETSADQRPGIAICVIQNAASTVNLTKITCRYNNKRRVLLGVKKDLGALGGGVTMEFNNGSAANWKLLTIAENFPLTCTLAGGATSVNVTGGFETDASLFGPSSGDINLYVENDPRLISRFAPRWAWVECYINSDI